MSEKTSKETKAGNKTAAKDASKGDAAAAINDTFGGSPVTTELSGSSISAAGSERDENSFAARAMKAGIGEVRVEGIDFRYIGPAPGRDTQAKTPSGYPITTDNSRFTPLAEVAFSTGLRYKDPKTGAYYFAPEATSFAEVNLDGKTLA